MKTGGCAVCPFHSIFPTLQCCHITVMAHQITKPTVFQQLVEHQQQCQRMQLLVGCVICVLFIDLPIWDQGRFVEWTDCFVFIPDLFCCTHTRNLTMSPATHGHAPGIAGIWGRPLCCKLPGSNVGNYRLTALRPVAVNRLGPDKIGRHFADNTSRYIFMLIRVLWFKFHWHLL